MRLKAQDPNTNEAARYSTERRRQLTVLLILAAAILIASILITGLHNIFLPHWWRIDIP